MANISKGIVDPALRKALFDLLHVEDIDELRKISNQSYGVALDDLNGKNRMLELRVIIREEKDGMTGSEQLEAEAAKYADKVREDKEKAEKRAAEKAVKIEKDKARRAKKKKEAEENTDAE